MDIFSAIAGRRSIRKFLPQPVPVETVERLLALAARAPSGVNVQPWRVWVVRGETKRRLTMRVKEAAERGVKSLEYQYLQQPMSEPYLTRRRALGAQLYTAYGIDRSDYPARSAAMMRNFDFFGADVGVFFAMERALSLGSWLDLGAFMQTFMLAARGEGLETCPQQAWCEHGAEVRAVLGIPDDCIIVSGLALGYAETSAAENKMQTSRADVHNFARFME